MISIIDCQKILTKGGTNLSDEAVIKLRDKLYEIAHLDYQIIIEQQKETNNEEKCHNIYSSQYRRAS